MLPNESQWCCVVKAEQKKWLPCHGLYHSPSLTHAPACSLRAMSDRPERVVMAVSPNERSSDVTSDAITCPSRT